MSAENFWAVPIDGQTIRRTSEKDPNGIEYVPAKDYDELLDWVANHKTCIWKHNIEADDEDTYTTSCGRVSLFIESNPAKSNFLHCPYCGGKLNEQ